jgi:hypothetical protein
MFTLDMYLCVLNARWLGNSCVAIGNTTVCHNYDKARATRCFGPSLTANHQPPSRPGSAVRAAPSLRARGSSCRPMTQRCTPWSGPCTQTAAGDTSSIPKLETGEGARLEGGQRETGVDLERGARLEAGVRYQRCVGSWSWIYKRLSKE